MVMGGRKVGRFGVRIGVRMFSMEDRRRAVDLYFTEGMTIRKVVAKLGYPSEGALAKWVREDPRCTVPLAFHKFYLLRYCVFCTPRVRNVGIPPLCETYPPFCEHPFGASSYPARSYEQSQSMTLVIWMPSSVMPSLCQSRVSTVRGNASPNRRSGANSRSRVCSSVMFNVT